jgi:hypothetical protein
MAAGHRGAARGVLDDGEHNATLDSRDRRVSGIDPHENGHAVLPRSSSANCNWSALQLFRATAELLTQQTLDQQVQLVDFGIALLHRNLQGCLLLLGRSDHLTQHLLQRCGIVRQGGEVDLHASIVINAVESAPMTPA